MPEDMVNDQSPTPLCFADRQLNIALNEITEAGEIILDEVGVSVS